MVIKILKNSTSFSGIVYNDDKVETNKGSLIEAKNFPFQDMDAKDYDSYLEKQSSLNKRVKNKQFHVAISTKARAHTFKELKDVAHKYLDHMGYSDNPYLIYAHTDSPNNHIHIVTTRVDKCGKKINDSLERFRTENFIRKELNIDYSRNVNTSIKSAFDYKFKDVSALGIILKRDGYKSRNTEKGLEVIKSGKVQRLIAKRKIKDHIFRNQLDFKQTNAIKAQLYKYSSGSDFSTLQNSLKKNFGLDLIPEYNRKKFHNEEDDSNRTVVNYHLIDYQNKTVYGSRDLLTLETLKEQFDHSIEIDELSKLIQEVKTSPFDIHNTREFFKQFHVQLKYNGDITRKSGEVIGKLDQQTMDNLKYNQNASYANKLNYTKGISPAMLANIYNVKITDIAYTPKPLDNHKKEYYIELVKSKINANPNHIDNYGKQKIYTAADSKVLLDYETNTAINIEKDLNIVIPNHKLVKPFKEVEPMIQPKNETAIEILSLDASGLDASDEKKKRKRRRDLSINQ